MDERPSGGGIVCTPTTGRLRAVRVDVMERVERECVGVGGVVSVERETLQFGPGGGERRDVGHLYGMVGYTVEVFERADVSEGQGGMDEVAEADGSAFWLPDGDLNGEAPEGAGAWKRFVERF